MKIVTVEQMRRIEAQCTSQGISTSVLMQNAGLAVAEKVREYTGDVHGARMIALIGPGNNGGDGLVAARHLTDWGAIVHVVLCAPRRSPDPVMEPLLKRGVHIVASEKSHATLAQLLPQSKLVLDALLGTGRARPLQGAMRDALKSVNLEKARRQPLKIVAVDLPTGLDADTGSCDPVMPQVDVTIALGFPKVGMVLPPGSGRLGRLVTVNIGVPPALAGKVQFQMTTADWARSTLPERPADANKGTFGRVLIIAGSAEYIGAAYLSSAGALRVGAGLVTLATPKTLSFVVVSMLPEVTHLPLAESEPGVVDGEQAAAQLQSVFPRYDAVIIGPGLGQHSQTKAMFQKLLATIPASLTNKVVLDADALNILAAMSGWQKLAPKGAVVTPHPGEMSRLTGKTIAHIQANRLTLARDKAKTWAKTVVVKGAYTVIASPDGQVTVNPYANPALATAGTGDVLAGVIASLIGQGLPPFRAAALGAYLHGAAGEIARSELGDTGVIASDLLPRLPRAIRDLQG